MGRFTFSFFHLLIRMPHRVFCSAELYDILMGLPIDHADSIF